MKSLLDQMNLHDDTTSLSRDVSRAPSQIDLTQDLDLANHKSVQIMQQNVQTQKYDTQNSSMVSATANLYVKNLL